MEDKIKHIEIRLKEVQGCCEKCTAAIGFSLDVLELMRQHLESYRKALKELKI
jgi:hypothetical protein